MRIERLSIGGFGPLRGEVQFATDRCNLILAPNESGKSTLIAGLLAALYGIPDERRSRNRPITLREAHRPWDKGPYRVEIEFTVSEKGYTLMRDFDTDEVVLRERSTGKDITEGYRRSGGHYAILEELLQLERQDFVHSALVRQHEIHSIRSSSDITNRLQRFATSQDGSITAGEALQALDRALTRYPGTRLAGPGKVETEIRRIDERADALAGRLETLEGQRAAAETMEVTVDQLSAEENDLRHELQQLDFLRTRAVIREIEADLEERQRTAGRLAALCSERDGLEPYHSFPLDLVDEMNELRGKAQELTARLEEERQALQQNVVGPIEKVRQEIASLAGVRKLELEGKTGLNALGVRLGDLDQRIAEKERRKSVERRRLEAEGVDIAAARATRERFASLADADRRFLEGYRERTLELRDRRRELEDLPLPDITVATTRAAMTQTLTTASAVLLLGAGPLILVLAGWTRSGLTLLLALLGLAALGGGLLLLKRPGRIGSPPSHPEMSALDEELRTLDEHAEQCRRALSCSDTEALLEAFRQWTEDERRTATLERLVDEQRALEDDRKHAAEQAVALLRLAGCDTDRNRVDASQVDAVRESAARLRLLDEKARGLDERRAQSEEETQALLRRLEGVGLRMDEILHLGNLRSKDQEPDASAAIGEPIFERFMAASREAERYLHLSQELIPEAESGGATEEWFARRRQDQRTMEEELSGMMQRAPLEVLPDPDQPSSHYLRRYKRTREKLDEVVEKRRAAQDQASDRLRACREEIPQLLEERESLERARRRADGFSQSVRLASEMLTEIARESYEEWAAALNDRTSAILAFLNPAYRDIRFDTDLSFTIESVASGRRLDRDAVDAQLSSGARDQIYLSIRLAVSEFFSAGAFQIPLILDDVLGTSDDQRFDRALTFLAEEVSQRHQIILVSCQVGRHRQWQKRHRDLFDARFVTLDLQALRPS